MRTPAPLRLLKILVVIATLTPSSPLLANSNPLGMMALMMDTMMQMMVWMMSGGGALPGGAMGAMNPMSPLLFPSQSTFLTPPFSANSLLPYSAPGSVMASPGTTNLLGLNALANRSPMALLGLTTPGSGVDKSTPQGGEDQRKSTAVTSGYVGIEGIWSAPSGEYWAVKANQFIFFGLNGTPMRGEYTIRGDWIMANSYPQQGRESVTIHVQFRQMDDLLLLRNQKGQVTLLQRQFDPQKPGVYGGLF
ncbi:MAG: hypothetical protein HQL48_01875 [Gammaproteobacteria bacterium]|nr:hypothetical protein [Gammaproteobacteria bacterium]